MRVLSGFKFLEEIRQPLVSQGRIVFNSSPHYLDLKGRNRIHQRVFMATTRGIREVYPFSSLPMTSTASTLRIFNVDAYLPESCAVAYITWQEYRSLQALGLTLFNEDALTAKMIGYIGQYRLHVLHDQEQWGLRSDVCVNKEIICARAIKRLRWLQAIERLHGMDYETVLTTINTRLQGPCYEPDREALEHLRHRFLRQVTPESARPRIFGCDSTRNLIADFVTNRVSAILRAARRENDYLTIGSNNPAIFRGLLNQAIEKAEACKATYLFDQNHRILKEHQGDYEEHSRIIVTSSQLVGTGRGAINDFLFGINAVLQYSIRNPFIAPPSPFVRVHPMRRYYSLWKRITDQGYAEGSAVVTYYDMRDATLEATLSFSEIFLKMVISLVEKIGSEIKHAVIGMRKAFQLGLSDWIEDCSGKVFVTPLTAGITPAIGNSRSHYYQDSVVRKSRRDQYRRHLLYTLVYALGTPRYRLNAAQENGWSNLFKLLIRVGLFWPLRVAWIPFNALFKVTGFWKLFEKKWWNYWAPSWREVVKPLTDLTRVFIRVWHYGASQCIRGIILLGRTIKNGIKMLLEGVFNLLAIVMKHPRFVFGFCITFSVAFCYHVSWGYSFLLGVGGAAGWGILLGLLFLSSSRNEREGLFFGSVGFMIGSVLFSFFNGGFGTVPVPPWLCLFMGGFGLMIGALYGCSANKEYDRSFLAEPAARVMRAKHSVLGSMNYHITTPLKHSFQHAINDHVRALSRHDGHSDLATYRPSSSPARKGG